MSTTLAGRHPERLMALGAVALLVIGALSTDGFISSHNFKAILASVGILGIVAVGMTCITMSGNLFSLSLGVTVTVTSMAFLSWLSLGVGPAIAASVLLGAAIGATQGTLIGGLGANPIVITIAAGSVQLGLATKLSGGSTIYPTGGGFDWLAGNVWGLPVSVFFLIGLVLLLELWFRTSRTGRELQLTGENRPAAKAGGLRVTATTVVAFTLAGACAGLGGVLLAATSKNASLVSGSDLYTFNAIAVVLVGGIAVTGGRGAVGRTLLGALFIGAISDMLLLRGYSTGIQTLVTGLFVLLAIIAVQLGRRSA